MIRILIADDHSFVRRGLVQVLQEGFPSAHIGQTSDAEELLEKVFAEEWDIAITDISMPGRSGLEVLPEIRQRFPKLPILVLSTYPEDQYAIRAMRTGASGYLRKDADPEELVKAVQCLLLGKKHISLFLAERLAGSLERGLSLMPHECLSNREFEVMRLLACGISVTEIATALSLRATTISTFRSRVMAKMNAKSNADLTRYAMENKLL
jgi:two-component system, NarL family, invasion response regulator UvrY